MVSEQAQQEAASGSPNSLEGRLHFLNEQKLPAVLTPLAGQSLQLLLTEERDALAATLLQYGAILFRGFDLTTPQDFRAAAALCFENGLQSYVGGVSPRGQVMAGIYESTSFPAHLRLPQHNEMAYLPDSPRALAFFCEVEPRHGGETPLAHSRAIYNTMPDDIRQEFGKAGISYHRYLYGPRWNIHHLTRNRVLKLHTSWMAAFGTKDPAVVEKAVAETGGTVTWDREEGAKISHTLPAFRPHPETGELLWFNQVSTFVSSPKTAGRIRCMLYRMAYPNPFRRPMHAQFGDKRPISTSQLNRMNDTINDATVMFRWQRGDFLLVDNFLVTHGRMPFKGDRRILVAIH